MRWTLEQVAQALGVAPPAGVDPVAWLAGVSIDSRTLHAGELFLAIHGPRHDGHTFVAAALAAGAPAAVVARGRMAEYPEDIRRRLLAVDDPLAALQKLARQVRRKWAALGGGRRLVAVTGSTGKTTTKEILASLLGARLRVLKSEGNLNNEYGLPLTLLKLEDGHEAAVVEVGMSHRGELARLAEICEPEVGVVTNVAPVHLEFFSSVDEIALAKRELIEGLAGPAPVAVLNADDERVARFAKVNLGKVITFGLSAGAMFRAERVEDRGVHGSTFDLVHPRGCTPVELALVGRHNVANALAAVAAASVGDLTPTEIQRVLRGVSPAPMRGEVLVFDEKFTVINDCYNSNPVALASMIRDLAAMPNSRRRVLVAGEMLELGRGSTQWHLEAGQQAASAKLDWVVGVQGHAAELVRGAVECGVPAERTKFFASSEEAAAFVAGFVAAGDVVLVKGSRGVKMERIIEALRAKYTLSPESVTAAGGGH